MALLRLSNGNDVLVKLEVADAIAAISIGSDAADFVELPGDSGPIHVRPQSVIAIIESVDHKKTGFRPIGS